MNGLAGSFLIVGQECWLELLKSTRHPNGRAQHIGWATARDVVLRGHVKRAELRGVLGHRLLAECAAAGVKVVVERESMGIKWVRFEKEQDGKA